MNNLGLSQKDVSQMTGYSKASVSMWLSGRSAPPEEKQAEIAICLGQPDDYFKENKPVSSADWIAKRITPRDAAKILGLSKETIEIGLKQGVFPWGYAVHMPSGKWVYWINKEKMLKVEKGNDKRRN